jgi:hypothetical protein
MGVVRAPMRLLYRKALSNWRIFVFSKAATSGIFSRSRIAGIFLPHVSEKQNPLKIHAFHRSWIHSRDIRSLRDSMLHEAKQHPDCRWGRAAD